MLSIISFIKQIFDIYNPRGRDNKRLLVFASFLLMASFSINAWSALVGHWRLDEGSGLNTADTSGNGRTGTLMAAPSGSIPTWINDGINGKALHFDGTGYVDLANTASLNFGASGFTIAAWVRYGTVGYGEYMIVSKHSAGYPNGYFIENWNPSGNANVLAFFFYSDPRSSTTATYDDQQWHFIVGTNDGATGRLYVDGQLVVSNAGTPTANTANLLIGGVFYYYGDFAAGFVGDIDDVRVYDTALTDADIQQMYQAYTGYRWAATGNISDCGDHDRADFTGGDVPDPAECNATTLGLAAVCWDQTTHTMPFASSPVCTYKSLPPEACVGGWYPGVVYECQSVQSTTLNSSLSLEPHQWHLISPLPLDGGGSTTVGEIVGDDVHAGNLPSSIYGNAGADGWIMYQHNALTNLYENLTIDSLLTVGQGYWLKTLAANQSFTVNGNANSVTPIDLEAAPNPADGRSNMLGHPYDYNVCWNDAQISNDNFATFETPTTADPGNICDTDPADPTCILSRKMYKWNGAAYQTFDGTTPGAEGVLEPFDGFFIKVFKPGYQLQIPATPSCQSVTAAAQATLARALKTTDGSDPESASTAKKVRNPDEWNIRLTVSAEGLTDPGNLIGRLNDSRDGHDTHDLDERPADFNPHLTLVFPHHDWDNHAGDYTTDYRALERNPTGVTDWDFEIRSDQLRTITLTWDIDNQDIRNHSLLIDVENKVTIKPKKVNRYTIPMVGTTHRFTWRMQAGR